MGPKTIKNNIKNHDKIKKNKELDKEDIVKNQDVMETEIETADTIKKKSKFIILIYIFLII